MQFLLHMQSVDMHQKIGCNARSRLSVIILCLLSIQLTDICNINKHGNINIQDALQITNLRY